MRETRVFVLRLFVDPAESEALRGDLQPVPEGEAQSFTDEETLLALLRRLTGETAEPSGTGTGERSSEPRFPAGGGT